MPSIGWQNYMGINIFAYNVDQMCPYVDSDHKKSTNNYYR